MKMKEFESQGRLEELVMMQAGKQLIAAIVENERLDRPDILAEDAFFNLPLRAATMLALVGLPREMRGAALDLVAARCGEDSEVYEFLADEFEAAENPDEPDEAQRRMLKAIREKDEIVVCGLADFYPCFLSTTLPSEYIPCLLALSEKTRTRLIAKGVDNRVLAQLLQQLLTPDTEGAVVPAEVKALAYAERMTLINEIIVVLMDNYHDEDEYDEYDEEDDDEFEDDDEVEDEDDEEECEEEEDLDDYEYIYDPEHRFLPPDYEGQSFDFGDEDEEGK